MGKSVRRVVDRSLILGALLLGLSRVIPNPRSPQAWAEAVGIVGAAIGARGEIQKSGARVR